jgi:excisionase family DNA binding protein
MIDEQRLMKADEVSKMLGCHSQHVYRLASEGRLDSLKIGRWRRFRPAQVAAFVEGKAGVSDGK